MLGRYPQDMVELYQKAGVWRRQRFKPEDLALMHQKLDFVGLNYYNDFWGQGCSGVDGRFALSSKIRRICR